MLKKAISFQKLNDAYGKEESNNSQKYMNMQWQFLEVHKAFITRSNHHVNIGLHMFQNRMWNYKIRLKYHF